MLDDALHLRRRKGSRSQMMRRMRNVDEELVARQAEPLEELGGRLDAAGPAAFESQRTERKER